MVTDGMRHRWRLGWQGTVHAEATTHLIIPAHVPARCQRRRRVAALCATTLPAEKFYFAYIFSISFSKSVSTLWRFTLS